MTATAIRARGGKLLTRPDGSAANVGRDHPVTAQRTDEASRGTARPRQGQRRPVNGCAARQCPTVRRATAA